MMYTGSNEEKEDLKKAYLSSKGSIASILSHIPHCTHEDEQRFIAILNPLVTSGELRSFPAWDVSVKDEKGRKARKAEGEKEAQEAELLAKDLGVWNEFYGDGKVGERMGKGKSHGKGKSKADEKADEDVLKAVIQRKNKDRDPDDFLDGLLSKYGGGDKPSRGKKRGAEDEKGSKKKARMEPDIDDAEFERLQKEIFGEKSKAGAEKKAKATPTKSKAKKTK
jgi:DnaJ family protein C protein 9